MSLSEGVLKGEIGPGSHSPRQERTSKREEWEDGSTKGGVCRDPQMKEQVNKRNPMSEKGGKQVSVWRHYHGPICIPLLNPPALLWLTLVMPHRPLLCCSQWTGLPAHIPSQCVPRARSPGACYGLFPSIQLTKELKPLRYMCIKRVETKLPHSI